MSNRFPDNGGGRRNLLTQGHPSAEISTTSCRGADRTKLTEPVLFGPGLTGPFCFPPDRFAPATGSLDLQENILVLFIALEVI